MLATIMLVWSTLGAFWAYLRQQQQSFLPSTSSRSNLGASTSGDAVDATSADGGFAAADGAHNSNHHYRPHCYHSHPSGSRCDSNPEKTDWSSPATAATTSGKSAAAALAPRGAGTFTDKNAEQDILDRIFSSISQISFSMSNKHNATTSCGSGDMGNKPEPGPGPGQGPDASGTGNQNGSSQASQTSQAASGSHTNSDTNSISKCSDPSLSNNSSAPSGGGVGIGGGGRSRIPYHAMDLTAGHHHHCCHQYHPYSDPSLSEQEPSCPLLIFRESPSSATTASGSLATHGSIHTPSPYQSTPDLDLTSDCASDCGIDAVTGARLSAVYLAASRRGKLISDTSLCSVERCRMAAHKATSSGASTPSTQCPISSRSHPASTYYYTHRHSHSAVMSHSNSSLLGTQTSASLASSSRRHRSSYPSTGIRHSISGTLRIGPRIYRGRSSQRCALML